jgi:hypothetical protein
MTKVCTKCKLEKEVKDNFSRKGQGYQSNCKPCQSERFRTWRDKRTKEELELHYKRRDENKQVNMINLLAYLKENPCYKCGETDPVVLEFDHRDRTTKSYDIGAMVNQTTKWETIMKEISKCDVLCANCHRRKTASQMGWWKANLK